MLEAKRARFVSQWLKEEIPASLFMLWTNETNISLDITIDNTPISIVSTGYGCLSFLVLSLSDTSFEKHHRTTWNAHILQDSDNVEQKYKIPNTYAPRMKHFK